MKFGVIVFPGSNCDIDCYHVIKDILGQEVEYIWHDTERLEGFDCIILPGGFSYGDYLRCGAVATFSRVMDAIKEHASEGKLVIGICNGFQILTEAGLLPGALLRNKELEFICDTVAVRVEESATPFTSLYTKGESVYFPIAHGEGRYFADAATLEEMRANGQILFTYVDNPNGSIDNIAGICNKRGNVLGMMPHPERACEELLGSADGKRFFESILKALEGGRSRE